MLWHPNPSVSLVSKVLNGWTGFLCACISSFELDHTIFPHLISTVSDKCVEQRSRCDMTSQSYMSCDQRATVSGGRKQHSETMTGYIRRALCSVHCWRHRSWGLTLDPRSHKGPAHTDVRKWKPEGNGERQTGNQRVNISSVYHPLSGGQRVRSSNECAPGSLSQDLRKSTILRICFLRQLIEETGRKSHPTKTAEVLLFTVILESLCWTSLSTSGNTNVYLHSCRI